MTEENHENPVRMSGL